MEAVKLKDKKRVLLEAFFDIQKAGSIWREINYMVCDHIMFKTLQEMREAESNKDTVIWNKPMRNLLETGYIKGQALFVRNLTQERTKSNKPHSIPELIKRMRNELPKDLADKCDEETIFSDNGDVKIIRDFSDQYVAHIDRNRQTEIASFKAFQDAIEKCHGHIVRVANKHYGILANATFSPTVNYQGAASTKLDGLFCSKETGELGYKFYGTMSSSYLKDDLLQ